MAMDEDLQEHYAQLLGLQTPWNVSAIDLKVEDKRVDIHLEHPNGVQVACPVCQRACPIQDRLAERTWRHLDTMQFETRLHARLPRCRCPEHNVKTIAVPWAGAGSAFTLLFEKLAIDVLKACATVKQAAGLLGLSWQQVHTLMSRAVDRGLERRSTEQLRYLGLDEKSFLRGQSYVSLMVDLEGARVLEVMEGKDTQAADFLWATLEEGQLDQIEAVAMDMSAAFIDSAQSHLPQAAIVHDRFHIASHLNEAVAKVFRAENKKLRKEGEDCLKGTRQLWLMNPENLSREQKAGFRQLKDRTLKVSRAWAIKELFDEFWNYRYEGSATKFFKRWFGWASRSRLKPIIQVARMLRKHFERLITYLKHPITNAVTEGLNAKIQNLKTNARGFRSFLNYRTRILFFCGKLNLYPQ